MKSFSIFSFVALFSIVFFSCKNDHDEYGPLKGINYFSRNDAFPLEQVSFENASGISNDTLKKLGLLTIAPNTFSNEDGSPFSGKIYLSIKEDFVRGFMALNSIPSVLTDGSTLHIEGSIYFDAADLKGNKLMIAAGKNIEISIPGTAIPSQNKMYYGEDLVTDPAPVNTSLFSWKESSADSVVYYFNSNVSKYYYQLKPTKTGWISCGREASNSNPVGIKVRVSGFFPSFETNTAVYVVPKNGKSAFRLWNYDNQTHYFSTDKPYLDKGSEVYIIVIASGRHFKIYYAKELITVEANTEKTVTAGEATLGNIETSLYSL